jgi:hypothetical protein
MVRDLVLLALLATATPALAQGYDPASRQAAQREAMAALDAMNGTWRGEAWTTTPQGKHVLTQTERVGPMLGGTVKVIEGKGYEKDGSVGFNAFAVVSYDPARKAYQIQSNAMGFSGTYPLRATADGFVWETPAGPGATMRYTATLTPTTWVEVGERIAADGTATRTFEMRLTRLGDTDWPASGAVAPQ